MFDDAPYEHPYKPVQSVDDRRAGRVGAAMDEIGACHTDDHLLQLDARAERHKARLAKKLAECTS